LQANSSKCAWVPTELADKLKQPEREKPELRLTTGILARFRRILPMQIARPPTMKASIGDHRKEYITIDAASRVRSGFSMAVLAS
jgi:hypothetical protein